MFDYGISSLLTQEEPLVLDAVRELGGVSLRLEGTAELTGTVIPFSLEVVVKQSEGTERGVPVVRKSSSDAFDVEITTASTELTISFDPSSWLANLRAALFEQAVGPCEIGVAETCPALSFDADSDVARVVGQAMTAGVRPDFSLK
jgi:hypothetical protein